MQQGSGLAPVPLHGAIGDSECGGGLFHGQAGEESQLDQSTEALVDLGELVERPIQVENLDSLGVGVGGHVLQSHDLGVAAALLRAPAPRVVDQDLAHGHGRDAEEVIAVLPVDPSLALGRLLTDHLQIGLVHEASRLQGLAGPQSAQLPPGEQAQALVDQRHHAVECLGVVIGFLILIAPFGGRALAQEAPDAAPPLPPDAPASSHFMLEQRPLPGSVGGGTGMGKGRVGPGSAPVPDAVVADYLDSGQYEELARLFRERLAFLDVTAPGRDPRIATALKNLGLVYQLQARFDDAAALYERALEQHRRLDGDQSATVALTASQLATVYQAMGRLQEAEQLHLEAVSIFKQSRAPQHLDVGLSLNNLAHLYVRQRRVEEARKLFRRALAIFEAARGPIHSDVALAHTNIALCAKLAGDKSEALAHFTRAIEIFTALGRDRPELAIARDNLASFFAEEGSWKEALSEADQATGIIIKQAQRGVFDTTAAGDANAAAVPWNQAALARYVKAAWEVWRSDRGADAALREKAFGRAQWISQTSTAKALADMAARQAKGDTPLAALARRRQDFVARQSQADAAA